MKSLPMKVLEYFKTISKVKRNFFSEMAEENVSEHTADKFRTLASQHQTIVDEVELAQTAIIESELNPQAPTVHEMKH